MAVHVLKLSVGCDSVETLESWQRQRLEDLRRRDGSARLMHVTRQTPRRSGFAPGSSIFWVMGGFIRCRQVVSGLTECRGEDGILRCGLVLDPHLVPTEPLPRRPFQGWRYIDDSEAPRDLSADCPTIGAMPLPPEMRAALMELRLI